MSGVERTDLGRDLESDPAHNVDPGRDWADEGGATSEGPATHEESGHPHHEEAEASD